MDISRPVHPLMRDGQFLPTLAITSDAAGNTHVKPSCRHVFPKCLLPFTSPLVASGAPVSPLPHQPLALSVFSIAATLVAVKWYLVAVLIDTCLRTNDVEHLFMCLLATRMPVFI